MGKGPEVSKRTLALLVVLVIIVVGGGGYYFLVKKKASSTDSSGAITPVTSPQTGAAGTAPTDTVPTPGATPAGSADATQPNGVEPQTGAAGADAGAGAAATPAAGAGAGATPAGGGVAAAGADAAKAAGSPQLSLAVTNGANISSNTPYGTKVGALVASLLTKNQINSAVEVDLIPARGGIDTRKKGAVASYRKSVTSAVLQISFTDATTLQQWTQNSKKVRSSSVEGFLKLMRSIFPSAQLSTSVVDPTGNLLAVGDQTGAKASVQVLG